MFPGLDDGWRIEHCGFMRFRPLFGKCNKILQIVRTWSFLVKILWTEETAR
jgi:hypothetical protein